MNIVINKKFTLSSKEQDTILNIIHNHNYSHEYSCQIGRCNSCKVKLIEGKTSSIFPELGLSKEEKKNGYILSCCRITHSDIKIETDNLYEYPYIEPKIIPSQIHKLEYKTQNIIEISLKIPNSFDFKYYPGQYIKIKQNGETRSYSIMEYDSTKKIIKILCKFVLSGLFSKYFFSISRVRDRLTLLGPYGMSSFQHKKYNKIFFLATGVGISPIINFLNHPSTVNDLKNKEIILYWGNKFKKDFFYEFIREKAIYNLSLNKCLSKDVIDGNYLSGYVQNNFLNENKLLNDSVVYACGIIDMINDLRFNLNNISFDMDYFFSDAFIKSGVSN